MAHGYLGDGYGLHGESDDRDREWRGRDRDWHDRDWRERGSRDRDWEDRGHNRGFMFDERNRSDDRGMSRYGREHGYGGFQGDYSRGGRDQGGFGRFGDYSQGRRSYSAHPDDHYRSWRDRHMEALDRDYADYCRERESQFHQDFDAWLTQRHGNPQPLRTGMTQSGFSHDPSGELDLTDPAKEGQYEEDPVDTATLGTTSGGGKRR
jgi:hypothetical protein